MNKLLLLFSILFIVLGLNSCSLSSHFIKKNDSVLELKTTLKDSTKTFVYEFAIKNNSNRDIAIVAHENIRNILSDTLFLNAYDGLRSEEVHYSFEYMDFKNQEARYTIFSERPAGYVIRSKSALNFIIEIESNKKRKVFDIDYCFLPYNTINNKLESTNEKLRHQDFKFYDIEMPFNQILGQ